MSTERVSRIPKGIRTNARWFVRTEGDRESYEAPGRTTNRRFGRLVGSLGLLEGWQWRREEMNMIRQLSKHALGNICSTCPAKMYLHLHVA